MVKPTSHSWAPIMLDRRNWVTWATQQYWCSPVYKSIPNMFASFYLDLSIRACHYVDKFNKISKTWQDMYNKMTITVTALGKNIPNDQFQVCIKMQITNYRTVLPLYFFPNIYLQWKTQKGLPASVWFVRCGLLKKHSSTTWQNPWKRTPYRL